MGSTGFEFKAIGTSWKIEIYDDLSPSGHKEIKLAIDRRIDQFDQIYSRFRPDSLVSQIAKSPGKYQFPDDSVELFKLYRTAYELTVGLVTPLIGGMMADAGYDRDYSFKQRPIRTVPDWDEVMSFSGTTLTTRQPVQLDFGAAGKGYLVDLVGEVLERHGYRQYLVNAGGDMRHRGRSPLRVGLEDPTDSTKAIGVFELRNKSLCASATNRRRWGDYHHVMDPAAQKSTDRVVATWAVADTTALADMAATALFFSTPDQLHQLGSFEYALIDKGGHMVASSALEPAIFKPKGIQ